MATCGDIEIDFREEARSIIADVSFAVRRIGLSERLDNSRECAYLNIITLEDQEMCIELDVSGLKVVGNRIDVCSNKVNPRSYESIYSLLDSVSPGYVQRFGEKLAGKLAGLQQ